MLLDRLLQFFCSRAGALRLRFAAFHKNVELAAAARSTAACFSFFPTKTLEAKPRPPFKSCFPIAFVPDLINDIIDFAKLEKTLPITSLL